MFPIPVISIQSYELQLCTYIPVYRVFMKPLSALSLLNTFVLFYNQQLFVFSNKFVTGRIFVHV